MKIAIDNGHGLNTAGKRTPTLPDGSQIREWEFNYPTAKKLGELLVHNGFEVVYVSDTEEDTPLKTRTSIANDAKTDIFVSIHYNAFQGTWGNHGGIETYHYPASVNGQRLAQEVQQRLIRETGLRDRGVKSANFYVLRETTMPAILCECGFMDNLEEAKLMLDEEYQWKCARGIAKGICSYMGVEYQELTDTSNEDSPQWAIEAREWVMEKGISDGSRPKDPATREEVWRMLQNMQSKI